MGGVEPVKASPAILLSDILRFEPPHLCWEVMGAALLVFWHLVLSAHGVSEGQISCVI